MVKTIKGGIFITSPKICSAKGRATSFGLWAHTQTCKILVPGFGVSLTEAAFLSPVSGHSPWSFSKWPLLFPISHGNPHPATDCLVSILFFISITPWSFPCRGIRVTIVSFLEEQRLDEREKFSGLWSLNVPGQSSVVWHLWDALDPRGCLCGLRVLYLTSPIFSIIFCTLPIAFVSSVAF